MQKWQRLALLQAKSGDFGITDVGEVVHLGGSTSDAVVEGGIVTYDKQLTSGGFYKKPLDELAQNIVRVIKKDNAVHGVIDQCFYRGLIVTTKGPAAWTCT
ncbi:MAG: hypothetical protein K9M10_01530 [Candidatus Pacebacteria bacterium]|nr:hypothetical protein [Candidatus Paceibacterota bacterium]MCF7857144.1 hypothetical protein [Candidatus Paceibacterota bacterium]